MGWRRVRSCGLAARSRNAMPNVLLHEAINDQLDEAITEGQALDSANDVTECNECNECNERECANCLPRVCRM